MARDSFSCDASTIFHAFSISRLSEPIVFWSSCESFRAVCTFAAFATCARSPPWVRRRADAGARAVRPSAREGMAGDECGAAAHNLLVQLAALLDEPLLALVRPARAPGRRVSPRSARGRGCCVLASGAAHFLRARCSLSYSTRKRSKLLSPTSSCSTCTPRRAGLTQPQAQRTARAPPGGSPLESHARAPRTRPARARRPSSPQPATGSGRRVWPRKADGGAAGGASGRSLTIAVD